MKESPIRTERKTIHLPPDTIQALNKLAARNGTDFSKEVRRAIDEYLDLESTAENIDMISGVIRQELSGQIKGLGNRLAGLINRLTIISAAGYYANIAIIADLIDRDRYSSFKGSRRRPEEEKPFAFANQKNADALRIFLVDEEMKKAIQAVQGGRRVNPDATSERHRHPNQKKTPKCNYAHIGYIATRPGAVKNKRGCAAACSGNWNPARCGSLHLAGGGPSGAGAVLPPCEYVSGNYLLFPGNSGGAS